MKLCWIVVLVVISIILVFLYSLVAIEEVSAPFGYSIECSVFKKYRSKGLKTSTRIRYLLAVGRQSNG